MAAAPSDSSNEPAFWQRINERLNDPETRGGTIAVLLLGLLPIAGFTYFLILLFQIPSVDGLTEERFEQSTIVYAEDGTEITRFYEKNRRWVPLDSIAEPVVEGLIATEDRRFYEHSGVDILRTGGAIFRTVTGDVQGGSTITMQLARNLFPDVGDDWIFTRKIKEWVMALRLESRYSKEDLLELYLNSVPYNYNAFGIEAAARTYFDTPAMAIDTLQAATLTGMLKGTSYYNPVDHPDRARERRNVVLQQMYENDYLSQAEYERLQDEATDLDFSPITPSNNFAPYFAEYVRRWMQDWADQRGINLYTAGLRVHTPIDAEMQQAAEQAVKEELDELQAVVDVSWSAPSVPYYSTNASAYLNYVEQVETPFSYYWEANPEAIDAVIRRSSRYRNLTQQGASEQEALQQLKSNTSFVDSLKHVQSRLQAGLVAMQPSNGHIKAWVGGRDFEQDQYDHVALARRQPGSTFKPFVYATALANGYHQNSLLRDEQIRYTAPRTGQVWEPENFGEETGQLMPISEGLAQSKNTITSQLIIDVGPSQVADYARRMGIESDLNEYPSLALGTSPVTLLEMARAYSTLANQGVRPDPVVVLRVENDDGRVLYSDPGSQQQAVPSDVAYGTLNMMRGVVQDGTGVRIRNQYGASGDLAAKTGTTQDNADGWFMLVHPDLVVGSWVGFNSPAVTFRTRFWGQGSHNALHVVGNFYRQVGLPTSATFAEPPSYTPPPSRDSVYNVYRDTVGADPDTSWRSFDSLVGDDEDESFDTMETDGFTDGDEMEPDTGFSTPDDPFGEPDTSFGTPDTPIQDPDVTEPQGDAADQPDAPEETEEPQSEADRLTRQAREQSQVDDALDALQSQDADTTDG